MAAAAGTARGNSRPIVPQEVPVAKEIAAPVRKVSEGSRASVLVSVASREISAAVPSSPITLLMIQAASRMKMGPTMVRTPEPKARRTGFQRPAGRAGKQESRRQGRGHAGQDQHQRPGVRAEGGHQLVPGQGKDRAAGCPGPRNPRKMRPCSTASGTRAETRLPWLGRGFPVGRFSA